MFSALEMLLVIKTLVSEVSVLRTSPDIAYYQTFNGCWPVLPYKQFLSMFKTCNRHHWTEFAIRNASFPADLCWTRVTSGRVLAPTSPKIQVIQLGSQLQLH